MSAPHKALPLDGGGLGGGVSPLAKEVAREASTDRPARSQPTQGSGIFEHDTHSQGAVKRARRMRREMTASEKRLWAALRKLDIGFRRQAPIGRYIADFAQHSSKIVIEVDGGCHRLPDVEARDATRDGWLMSQGYRVIRIPNDQAYADPWSVAEMAMALIDGKEGAASAPSGYFVVASLPTPPSPTLPPSRGKGEDDRR